MVYKIPTTLTPEQIAEYQRIYEKNFGEQITPEEALREGLSLVRLIAIVMAKDEK